MPGCRFYSIESCQLWEINLKAFNLVPIISFHWLILKLRECALGVCVKACDPWPPGALWLWEAMIRSELKVQWWDEESGRRNTRNFCLEFLRTLIICPLRSFFWSHGGDNLEGVFPVDMSGGYCWHWPNSEMRLVCNKSLVMNLGQRIQIEVFAKTFYHECLLTHRIWYC